MDIPAFLKRRSNHESMHFWRPPDSILCCLIPFSPSKKGGEKTQDCPPGLLREAMATEAWWCQDRRQRREWTAAIYPAHLDADHRTQLGTAGKYAGVHRKEKNNQGLKAFVLDLMRGRMPRRVPASGISPPTRRLTLHYAAAMEARKSLRGARGVFTGTARRAAEQSERKDSKYYPALLRSSRRASLRCFSTFSPFART